MAHAARAEFCRQLGRVDEARVAYERALELTQQVPERRFIEARIKALDRPLTLTLSPGGRGD